MCAGDCGRRAGFGALARRRKYFGSSVCCTNCFQSLPSQYSDDDQRRERRKTAAFIERVIYPSLRQQSKGWAMNLLRIIKATALRR
ncbi:MAG TPA: hypothetical protein PLQ88_18565 [Blastocatellia bacterium]|nr:hypothetical protein [Blastocatellia bacterium]